MGRVCSICARPDRKVIDRDLVNGVPLRQILKGRDIAIGSLSRHRLNHLTPTVAALVAAEVADDHSRSLVEILRGHMSTVDRLLRTAEGQGSLQTALQAVREARGLVELVAKMTGELDERPTVVFNLASNPEWRETRTKILRALVVKYPEAHAAVLAAIGGVPDSQPQVIQGRVIES